MARILVVDDEHDVAAILKFMLEKGGHCVAVASNGAEALSALGIEPPDPAKAPPDLIIMDVLMPVMDGYAAAARMFADPRTKGVPVVILTAKGELRESQQRTPNVAAYLDKPFDPDELRELVAKTLGKVP